MRQLSRLAPLSVVLVGLLAGGCATDVRDVDTSPGFAETLAAVDTLALGGVVVGPTMDMRLAPEDADDADEALYRAFLAARPDVGVLTAATVEGRLPAGVLAALREEYGRLGRLRPDQLEPAGADLDECRFLAMARITSDRTRTITPEDRGLDPDRAGAEGVPEQHEDWSNMVLVERELGLDLQVFDLATGLLAWEGSATTRDRQRYEYEDPLAEEAGEYVRDRLAEADEQPAVPRKGEALRVPDLVELLEQGLVRLVQRLPEASGR